MKTVWKYKIPFADWPVIGIKEGAEILRVAQVGGAVYMWAKVDEEKDTVKRKFRLAGTGHPLPEPEDVSLQYLDTVLINGGELVFHLFEVIE